MKKEHKDKELTTYFLNNPINREEFDNLYMLVLKIVEMINFKELATKFTNFYTEILDDEDKIYKKVTINLKTGTISIDLCQPINKDYFIAKNITFYNENNIQFCKKLVKIMNYNQNTFRELALKKWKYNGQGVSIKYFEEIETVDYTETIPFCSIYELRDTENLYKKCLSKSQNRHEIKPI